MWKVSVDDMFRWVIAVNVLGRPYWIRALSDTDTQERDAYALRVMALRRKALSTPGTDEHLVYIEGLADEDDDVLRSVVLAGDVRDWVREVQQVIQPQLYPFPDNATDEEKAETLARRDAEPERIRKLRVDWVNERAEPRKKQLAEFDHATLVRLAKERQIVAQTRAMYDKAFMDYTIYLAYFRDAQCTQRAFESVEQVGQQAPFATDAMADQYIEEMERITPEDLQYFLSMNDSKDSSST
ncbi:MAG: hypothetical protein HY868_25555 [Chloroflexi bacterium]|nr:hypothetical protein [Chloroflexota bacterium]